METTETAFAIDLRGISTLLNTMDQTREGRALTPDERNAVCSLGAAVRGCAAQADALGKDGHLTPAGVAAAITSKIGDVATIIERFETSVEQDAAFLQKTRELIESGTLARKADGNFAPVVRVSDQSPVSAIRAGEIRATVRALTPDERRAVILKAFGLTFDNGRMGFTDPDPEVLDAIETAPRSLSIIDALTAKTLAEARWQRAGWADTYNQKIGAVSLRRRVAASAREALGFSAQR